MTESELITAHKHSSNHRDEIESSELCGCFSCLTTFSPTEIEDDDWDMTSADKSECTLFCPKCGIDAIIGSSSGYGLDKAFLQAMKDHWFS